MSDSKMTSRTASRRTVATGAAWSIPTITVAAAAPAIAASPGCVVTPIVFSGTSGTSTADVTATATATKSGTFNTTTNNMTSTTVNGDSMIILEQSPQSSTSYQELTITFSQPVYNLNFSVTDIDQNSNPQMGGYVDLVSISKINGAASTSYTSAYGSNVQGSGTTAAPWKPTGTAPLTVGDTTGDVNVAVAPALPVTSFTIRYSSTTSGIAQQIYVGGITFTTTACTPS